MGTCAVACWSTFSSIPTRQPVGCRRECDLMWRRAARSLVAACWTSRSFGLPGCRRRSVSASVPPHTASQSSGIAAMAEPKLGCSCRSASRTHASPLLLAAGCFLACTEPHRSSWWMTARPCHGCWTMATTVQFVFAPRRTPIRQMRCASRWEARVSARALVCRRGTTVCLRELEWNHRAGKRDWSRSRILSRRLSTASPPRCRRRPT